MDMWMDVDAAVTVPVNLLPLVAVADFKTVLAAETYNEAGLELIWNFVTTAGVQSHTAITPTDTGGDYDWVVVGHGMYNIELPAAVNNTEGFGWFTGVATDALPWRGPVVGFRAAALNNALVDGATVDVNVTAVATDAITAAAIHADAVTEINTAVLAAISGIGSGTGAAMNFAPDDDNVDGAIVGAPVFSPLAPFVGVQTSGTFASAAGDDGTYHQIDDATNEIDIIYQFSVGSGRNCAKVVFTGYMGTGTGDTALIQAYNFITGAWDTRSTLIGQTGTTDKVQDVTLLAAHTGTGTYAGKVYIRFDSTASNQVLMVDSFIAQAQNLGQTVGYADGAIWIGGANTGTTPYVDGTADNPVTYAASKTLATALGLSRFRVRNGTTITLDASTESKSFIGSGWTLALGGQSIAGTYIEGATISGVSSGADPHFHDCTIGDATISGAEFSNCGFSGTLTLLASTNYSMIRCYDDNPSTVAQPIIAFAGGNSVGLRTWDGGIELASMTATDYLTANGSGRIVIGSTCSANPNGAITIRGPWAATVDNVSGGFKGTLTDTQRLGEDQSIAAVTGAVNSVTGLTASDVGAIKTTIGVAGAGLTAVPWNASWDAEVQSEAADAITAAALATAAQVAALSIPTAAANADAVWDEALAGHSGAGSSGLALSTVSTGGVDVNALADAIWDEILSGHTIAGSTGKKLSDLSIGGSSESSPSTASVGYPKPAGQRQYCDDEGVPLAGGFVYAYATGTTTPKDTFTTAALTVPNANPVVLDTAGRGTSFLTPGEGYDFVIKDADGVTQWSEVGVQVPSSADVTDIIAGGLAIDSQVANAIIKATSATQLGVVAPANDSVLVTNATGVPSFAAQGRLLVANSPAAVTGTSSTSEQVLQSVSIPAGALAAIGWGVRIFARGTFAANGNTKSIRLYVGDTEITATPRQSTEVSGEPWFFDVTVIRTTSEDYVGFGFLAYNEGTDFINVFGTPKKIWSDSIKVETRCVGTTQGSDITSSVLAVQLLRGTL